MDETPSKMSTGRPPAGESNTQPSGSRVTSGSSGKFGDSRRGTSRRSASLSGRSNRSTARQANATFLTDWSFRVSHDRLVQVITDVQPYEPYWEELTVIDLSEKNLESVARLKEFLPKLDSLQL